MRIIFMGTPEFSVPVLHAILAGGHDIAAVYTRAPKPAGRGLELTPSPVHVAAERLGLEVRHPKNFREAAEVAAFAALRADVAIVVAYGLILPRAVLDAPAKGCLNLHASLLPRWRGAAPVQRALMAGDTETGVMVMRMEEGLDTGPVGMAERLAIGPSMRANELHDALSRTGAELMGRALAALSDNRLSFTPQSEAGMTYARKIGKAEARIDWRLPALSVHNHIRGLSPFPGGFFEADFGRGPERVKVLAAEVAPGAAAAGIVLDPEGLIACGTGAVRLLTLQRAGKAAMAAADFFRGLPVVPGTQLASG